MTYIKQQFSITDLENFSNIKAHTIRIWEKRHELFTPDRHISSSARTYNLEDLKKILNIAYLNKIGYKISKIAALSELEIQKIITDDLDKTKSNQLVMNSLKIAMLEFDKNLFNSIFNDLQKKYSFVEIYVQFFMPFLIEIGYLWQSNSINSTHEHFISYIIIQKIKQETAKVEKNFDSETMYVLFLPENELHEISLIFCNYYLNLNQKNTLYLGQTIISNDIFVLNKKFDSICFISNISHQFGKENINQFISNFYERNLKNTNSELLISCFNFENTSDFDGKVKKFSNVKNMLDCVI